MVMPASWSALTVAWAFFVVMFFCHALGKFGRQDLKRPSKNIRLEAGVSRQSGPGRVSTECLNNRKCWREHRVCAYGSIQKLARDWRVVEDVLYAIHASPHFVSPFGLRAFVRHY